MAVNLKVGQVVRLKSGGPKMTVHEVDGTGITCVWFVGNEQQSGYFESETLDIE